MLIPYLVYSNVTLNALDLHMLAPFTSFRPPQKITKSYNREKYSLITTNSVCSQQNVTPGKHNFTLIISVHPISDKLEPDYSFGFFLFTKALLSSQLPLIEFIALGIVTSTY